jgi:fatty acid kinase fatty acid binding subunit
VPVPPVAIVTDSSFYAPTELATTSDIHVVSLYIQEGDRQYREVDIDDFGPFYERLRTATDRMTTSQPSIGDFLAVYEPLLNSGRDIVSIHLAGGISGTVQCARQAAHEALRDHPQRRIEVIDSVTGCGALGYVALAAAAVANAGGDFVDVIARARQAMEKVRLWFAIDTLEYLRRGGRIGAAQAWVGGALKIKPILTLSDEITPVERVRTSTRALERLVEFLRQQQADGADGWIIQHIQAADVADRLVDAGNEIFGRPPLFVNEIGPVIGVHVGPGLLGVGGGPAKLLEP